MEELEGMQQIRRRLAEYSSRPMTFVPVDAAHFRHLDLAFYDQVQQALQTAGFSLLGDFEIAELKGRSGDLRCFLRAMASRDGAVCAACFHPKPAWWLRLLMRLTGKPLGKTIEFETEFTDDTFVISATPPALLFDPPPLLIRDHYPAGTPVEKLLALHQAKIRAYLAANPGVAVRPVADAAGMMRMQARQHDIKSVYRQMVGGMSADEIRRFGGFTRARATRLKQLMDGDTTPSLAPGFPAQAAEEDKRVSFWKREVTPRGLGGLSTIAGTVLGYMAYYQPWQEALRHAPTIELSMRGAFASVLAVGYGLPYVIAPAATERLIGHPQQPTKAAYVYVGVLSLVAVGARVLFRRFLADLGYP